MIKPIIFGLVAFLLSLGGTTYVLVKRAPPPVQLAAAAAADSAKAGKEGKGADSTHAKPDSAEKKDSSGKSDTPAGSAAGKPAASAAVAKPVASKPPVDPAAKAAAVKQVARVLSAMKAAEAAKVLAFLSDEEVEGILRAVGPRQAADFMTNLPKERAANLSRRLMVVKS